MALKSASVALLPDSSNSILQVRVSLWNMLTSRLNSCRMVLMPPSYPTSTCVPERGSNLPRIWVFQEFTSTTAELRYVVACLGQLLWQQILQTLFSPSEWPPAQPRILPCPLDLLAPWLWLQIPKTLLHFFESLLPLLDSSLLHLNSVPHRPLAPGNTQSTKLRLALIRVNLLSYPTCYASSLMTWLDGWQTLACPTTFSSLVCRCGFWWVQAIPADADLLSHRVIHAISAIGPTLSGNDLK